MSKTHSVQILRMMLVEHIPLVTVQHKVQSDRVCESEDTIATHLIRTVLPERREGHTEAAS
jgi:hypothetical protein